jgi:predicted RNA-binding protein with RPS1 domain
MLIVLITLAVCASGLRGVRWGRWTNLQLRAISVNPRSGGGARALTKAEQKAKDQYDATRDPVVERVLPKFSSERTRLSELRVGQKLKGRIISVKDFGMFVDVDGEKDGLVHVKDISKDYFIQNHAGKFVPGQDIEVWVKFLVPDPDGLKLGLQMFPVSSIPKTYSSDTPAALSMVVGDAISGTVVRVSNYGVFVNVGLDFDAYLHKRKMKVARKMVKLMPWEISPVGTKINAFVHEVNLDQRRLSITTFPPETWAKSLPPPRSRTSNNENDEEVIDGNGSALSRIMALDLDDDADDDEEEDGVEVSVSDLSTSEIRALEQKRAQVVLDDLNASSDPEDWSAGLKSKKDTTRGSLNERDDLTSTELFNLISNGRPTITFKDLKCWDYLEELLDSSVIDEGQIKELLKINGEAGRLNEEQFDGFLDMLVDGLGFENEDLDEGLVDEELTSVSQIVQDEDEVREEKEEMELTSRPEKDLAELSMSKPKTSDLFNYVFQTVSGRKGHASLDDVLHWDFVQALVKRGDATPDSVSKMFEKASSAGRRSRNSVLDSAAFDKFVTLLSETPPTKSAPEEFINEVENDDEDEMTVDEAFAMLSNGKENVSLRALLTWDVVKELIEGGALTEAKFTDLFHQAGAKGRKTLTIDQFEVLLDTLSPFAEDEAEDEETLGGVGTHGQELNSKSLSEAVTDDDEDDDDVSDEKLVQDVFSALSNGKKHVSAKDLMSNYDFVRDLMGEGFLTEDSLMETMAAVGGSKRGVTMEQFSNLIDKLVLLFDDDEDPEGGVSTRVIAQGHDVILGAEGEYYDIDLENEFTSISKGGKTISLR